MAQIEVLESESLAQTKDKINQLSDVVGDASQLATPNTDDLVSAVNSVNTQLSASIRKAWVLAIAVA